MLFLGIVLGYIVLGWLTVQYTMNVTDRFDRSKGENPDGWDGYGGLLWFLFSFWPLAFLGCIGTEIYMLAQRMPSSDKSFTDWFFFTDAHK